MKKAIYYINQFFSGVGGEEANDFEPELREGAIGPGAALQAALNGVEITHTIICGDSFFASHREEALRRIAGFLEGKEVDLFLAGPAFRAGRYGMSCGEICKYANETYGVPAVTSMHPENPGVDVYRESPIFILKGSGSAAKMRQDIAAMAALANKLVAGEELLGAKAEGYFPRGIRKEVFGEKIAADRVVDMLLAKLNGQPFETEYKIEPRENIPPSKAVADLSKATIALVTTGGLVPVGNPDRMPTGTASIWKVYDISHCDALKAGEFYSVHAGINTNNINDNPELLLPLAPLRRLEKDGVVGKIHPYVYSTTGNLTFMNEAHRMGREIAEAMLAAQVDAAIFVST